MVVQFVVRFRIRSQGSHPASEDHPDAKAIYFEKVVYNKRKIADFISILAGLRVWLKVVDVFKPLLERYV